MVPKRTYGFAVKDADGINVRTVSPSRIGTMVNAILVYAKKMPLDSWDDMRIDEEFKNIKNVVLVRVVIDVTEDTE